MAGSTFDANVSIDAAKHNEGAEEKSRGLVSILGWHGSTAQACLKFGAQLAVIDRSTETTHLLGPPAPSMTERPLSPKIARNLIESEAQESRACETSYWTGLSVARFSKRGDSACGGANGA